MRDWLNEPQSCSDHAQAAAEILERYAHLLRSGAVVEDMARELLPIVRVMARRT